MFAQSHVVVSWVLSTVNICKPSLTASDVKLLVVASWLSLIIANRRQFWFLRPFAVEIHSMGTASTDRNKESAMWSWHCRGWTMAPFLWVLWAPQLWPVGSQWIPTNQLLPKHDVLQGWEIPNKIPKQKHLYYINEWFPSVINYRDARWNMQVEAQRSRFLFRAWFPCSTISK